MALDKEKLKKYLSDLRENPAFEMIMNKVFTEKVKKLREDYFDFDYKDEKKEAKFTEIHYLQKIEKEIRNNLHTN